MSQLPELCPQIKHIDVQWSISKIKEGYQASTFIWFWGLSIIKALSSFLCLDFRSDSFISKLVFLMVEKDCSSSKHCYILHLGLANLLCIEPHRKYLGLYRPYSPCCSYSTLPLYHESSQRKFVNKWVWLYSNNSIYKTWWQARFSPEAEMCWLLPYTIQKEQVSSLVSLAFSKGQEALFSKVLNNSPLFSKAY